MDIKPYLEDENIAIYCETEEEHRELRKKLHEAGKMWLGGQSYIGDYAISGFDEDLIYIIAKGTWAYKHDTFAPKIIPYVLDKNCNCTELTNTSKEEKMTNREFYKDEILQAFVDNTCEFKKRRILKTVHCDDIHCNECGRLTKEWLEAEHQEPENKEGQVKKLEKMIKPISDWLIENGNPHSKVIIEQDRAELLTGEASFMFKEEEPQKLWNGMSYAEAHKKMWTAMGDNINLNRQDWIKENNKNKENEPYAACFACQYDIWKEGDISCSKCPICDKRSKESCLNGLHDKWVHATGLKKAELAYKIANLEWREK